ncbi:MAG: Re/Si-specific NAD(P)(+) transhydrogenase subunit alpha [Lentimicrobiaceae bacterium]|nr:Re/Si-specific NAD(P)(+) transhydrogenase subunit alpha [Lentimicrobiaceae bacterium]MCB9023635.1 Re/Si-specific NAD(P)(+) transhydrogenase subunit alpha [Lentimicrobiaceae bacterium]MCO5264329.1 Re/Si-specific NAD(P)(+) transhydrogenase subunit alpha [Lentimicrobium sp.]
MTIGILKEMPGENRVVMLPESVATLVKMNVTVLVESGAGISAFASDKEYEDAGARIETKAKVINEAQLILKIQPPSAVETGMMKEGQVVMAALNPYFNGDLLHELASKKITSFSMDVVPRTTRAQAMDILSSMATVAGYKAVLTAANTLPKFFPMFMTAAGTIKPANMLILGAGVAGLQAIATSRKLGAVVYVFDVRAAVKEEVVGLGGKFVDVEGATDDKSAGGYAVEQTDEFKQRQAKAIHDQAVKSDVIICTAQIPGRQAPLLIKKETVEAMKPGSVIIDLAASTGGNCELTKNDETIVHNGIKIIGNSQLPTDMPTDASRMYGKNMINFLKLIITKEGDMNLNWEDDIVKGTAVTHNGEIVHERIKSVITK